MSNGTPTALERLAALYSIETQYTDVDGRRHRAARDPLTATLLAMGCDLTSFRTVNEAIAKRRMQLNARIVEPVLVAWDGRLRGVRLTLPRHNMPDVATGRIQHEDGTVHEYRARVVRSRSGTDGEASIAEYFRCRLTLNLRLPFGYHALFITVGAHACETRIVSAPRQAAPNGNARAWGVFLPLYAVRSDTNWGCGEFGELASLGETMNSLGAGVVASLPLLPVKLRGRIDPSPYAPVSRLFWNEFHLDIESIPELTRCRKAQDTLSSAAAQTIIMRARRSDFVAYESLAKLKRSLLGQLAEWFHRHGPSRRRAAYESYKRAHPLSGRYAAFMATAARRRSPWSRWSARLRDGDLRASDYDPAMAQSYLYAQWLAREQLSQCAKRLDRAGVRLYLDLPIGVRRDGFDPWHERDLFVHDASSGAPPDAVFTSGQNWGMPPLHPDTLRQQGYRYLRACVRHQLQYARMLRIDHVMQCRRLYWIADGLNARDGIYVRYDAEEQFAVLCLESHRSGAAIVGENLGIVPPEINRALQRHGIRRMHILQYELQSHGAQGFDRAPRRSVAALNTHDMPPLASFLNGDDIPDRVARNLLSRQRARREVQRRAECRLAMSTLLRPLPGTTTHDLNLREILRAVLDRLAASPAETTLINLEDLWLETQPQNIPGTSGRHNWRRKARFTLGDILSDAEVVCLLRRFDAIRRRLKEGHTQ